MNDRLHPIFREILAPFAPATGEERDRNEAKFCAALKDYLSSGQRNFHHRYAFGGAVNLCTNLSRACKQLAEETGSADWLTAAAVFEEAEAKVDLRYEPEAA